VAIDKISTVMTVVI